MLPIGLLVGAYSYGQMFGAIPEFRNTNTVLGRLDARLGGLDEAIGMAGEIARFAKLLGAWPKSVDQKILARMLELARARVPHLTGLLESGLATERDGEIMEFRASARRGAKEADYARFVEFGTRAGQRGRSIAYPTSIGQMRRRRQYRTHPGTEAQPFFWNSVREALRERERDAAALIAESRKLEG